MASPASSAPESAPRHPVALLLATMVGLYAWAAQFTVVYGFTAVACARGFAHASVFGIGIVRLIIVAASVAAFAVTAIAFVRSLRAHRRSGEATSQRDGFLVYLTVLISGLSLVAIVWTGLPAFLIPVCP